MYSILKAKLARFLPIVIVCLCEMPLFKLWVKNTNPHLHVKFILTTGAFCSIHTAKWNLLVSGNAWSKVIAAFESTQLLPSSVLSEFFKSRAPEERWPPDVRLAGLVSSTQTNTHRPQQTINGAHTIFNRHTDINTRPARTLCVLLVVAQSP